VNRVVQQKVQHGPTVIVYDDFTDTLVDVAGFDAAGQWALVR
jgi:RecJ-like exonuclease